MIELAARYADQEESTDPEPNAQLSPPIVESQESLHEIFQAHAPRVWRTLRALGVHESYLDDAGQDVFLVVNRRLSEFEGRSQMSTWLYSITYRVALAYRRKAHRRTHVEYEDTLPSPCLGPAEVLAEGQAAAFVRSFCSKLSEAKRDVFVLCVLEERSAPEVVESLGVNLSTVYSRLRAVKIQFRSALERQMNEQASALRRGE